MGNRSALFTKVSIAYNIERLKQFEQKVGARTEYQVALVSDPQAYPKVLTVLFSILTAWRMSILFC